MLSKIRMHFAWIGLLVFIAALAAPTAALAGGWVVITLDQLPEAVIAGQPYSLGITARQHGKTPWKVDALRIEATQAETGKTVTLSAKPDQQPGHYQAELLFPEHGRWEWGVASGLYPPLQPLPALEVAGASPSTGITGDKPTGINVRLPGVPEALPVPAPILGLFALLAFTAGVITIVRGRNKRVPLLAGVGLMILCGILAFAFFSSANAKVSQALPVPVTAADETTGQKLFLAKGCIVCHINDRAIKGSEGYSVNFGPNLTSYHNDPAFLQQLLKDPRSIKATTEMPNLELKPAEIEALAAFINHPDQK